MPLHIYQKKRNFKKTPEPQGKLSRTYKSTHLYVIQKHDASHLHYDFRLELNGVLLSWAVPKGPSLDPAVKRLAMHVEDHPIKYGSFEGIIPQGEYGGGTVMLWDHGKWICEDKNPAAAYKKGVLSFSLEGKKLKGKWKLIRIKNDDKTWLLFKVKDEFSKTSNQYDVLIEEPNSITTNRSLEEIANNKKKSKNSLFPRNHQSSPLPSSIHPQLATLVDQPPSGKEWLHEIKFD
jgi:bifunctional non-homologous end joining protein LigD